MIGTSNPKPLFKFANLPPYSATIQCVHCQKGEHTGESYISVDLAREQAQRVVRECHRMHEADERAAADSIGNYFTGRNACTGDAS